MKIIRCDSALEMDDSSYNKYFVDKVIVHQTICMIDHNKTELKSGKEAHESSQNGKSLKISGMCAGH